MADLVITAAADADLTDIIIDLAARAGERVAPVLGGY